MFPVRFDPEVHQVQETSFSRYLQGHFRDPLIFTYRHERTGNWVVAAWVKNRWGMFLELGIMGKAPVGNRGIVESMESTVRGSPACEKQIRENRAVLANMERRYEKAEDDRNEEENTVLRHLKRRAHHSKRVFAVPG